MAPSELGFRKWPISLTAIDLEHLVARKTCCHLDLLAIHTFPSHWPEIFVISLQALFTRSTDSRTESLNAAADQEHPRNRAYSGYNALRPAHGRLTTVSIDVLGYQISLLDTINVTEQCGDD